VLSFYFCIIIRFQTRFQFNTEFKTFIYVVVVLIQYALSRLLMDLNEFILLCRL